MPIIFDEIRSASGAVVFDRVRSVPGVLSVISSGQADRVLDGSTVELTVNQLPEAQGQVELQSADGLYHSVLNVTTWDATTGTVIANASRGELPYGITDAVLIVEDSTGAEFSRYEGLRIDAPAGIEWIDGDAPLLDDPLSVFYQAISPPAGAYQLHVRDPNNTGAEILASGEVLSADNPGDIYVSVWDATDGTTSNEVAFSINEVFDWVNATAEFASPAGYISKAGNETFTKYLYPVVAFEGQKTTIDAWPGTLTSYYHGYLKIEGLSIRTGM